MRLHLPGLFQDKRPNGSTRFRVRAEGQTWKKITLPVGPDDPAFMDHYRAARMSLQPRVAAPLDQPIPKSISWLTLQFEAWMEARVKAGLMHKTTLQGRRMHLERLRQKYGSKQMQMPRSKLLEFRDTMLETPGAADNMIKAVRACYAWRSESERLYNRSRTSLSSTS